MRDILERSFQQSVRAKRLSVGEMLDERSYQPLLARLGKIALYKTAGSVVVDALIGNYVNDPNFITSGSEQLVFRSDDSESVEKLIVTTLGSSHRKAEEMSRKYQDIYELAAHYMGDFWVDTKFEPVPLKLGSCAVVATQPALEIVKNFEDPEDIWTYSDDINYVEQQLKLLACIRNLYRETSMLPDFGRGNFVTEESAVGTERLKIVDTIPETPKRLDRPMWNNRSILRSESYRAIIGMWLEHLDSAKEAA
jgi:hypothetical protein